MSLVRIISAFLLAVLLLVGGYMVFWWLALQAAEQALVNRVGGSLGASITYDAPIWLPDPAQIRVMLPNISLRLTPEGTSATVLIRLPEATLQSGFFEADRRIQITLPPTWQVALVGDDPQTFEVANSNGRLLLLNGPGLQQVVYEADRSAVTTGHGASVLSVVQPLFSWKDENGKRLLRASAHNMQGTGRDMMQNVVVEVSPRKLTGLATPTWQVLTGRDANAIRSWFYALIEMGRRGGELDVPVISMKNDKVSATFFGNLGVARDGTPEGELTVTAGKADDIKEWLEAGKLFRTVSVEEEYRRRRVWENLTDARPQANLIFHQGTVIMNTQRVGRATSITEVVDKLVVPAADAKR